MFTKTMNYLMKFEIFNESKDEDKDKKDKEKDKESKKDKVLKGFVTLINAESNKNKSLARHLRTAVSWIHRNVNNKSASELKDAFYKEFKSAFDDRKRSDLFVGKVMGVVKNIPVTKFKELLKQIRSNTTGRKSD